MSEENLQNSSYVDSSLTQANDIMYEIGQIFAAIYSLLSFIWLVYMIIDVHRQVKHKRKLIANTMEHRNSEDQHKIYTKNENIFRSVLIVLFLLFESVYLLIINVYGYLYTFVDVNYIMIPIGPNCSVNSNTFIGTGYDTRLNQILLFTIGLIDDVSFAAMIWMFGATLFHMSFACRNQLKVKKVIYFILLGMSIDIFFTLLLVIPSVGIFTQIVQSLVDQFSVFVVVYIAKKKFFPAMDSRIKDAFNIYDINEYRTQVSLKRSYKYLISFVVLTFELYVLKDLIFYNIFLLIETISENPCYFRVIYHLHIFELSNTIQETLQQISTCNLIIVHLIDLVVYFNFILLNVNFFVIHIKIYFRNRKKIKYHYHIASVSLLKHGYN